MSELKCLIDNKKTITLGGDILSPPIAIECKLNLYDCDTAREHYITLTDGRGTAVSDTPTGGAIEVSGGYITGGNTSGSPGRGGGVFIDSMNTFTAPDSLTYDGNAKEANHNDSEPGHVTAVIKAPISATVTFKVANGSWDEGEGEAATADKTVTLTGWEGDVLKLPADKIPAVGKKPAETYKAGKWDDRDYDLSPDRDATGGCNRGIICSAPASLQNRGFACKL